MNRTAQLLNARLRADYPARRTVAVEPLEPRVLLSAAQADPQPVEALEPAVALSATAEPGNFNMDGNVDITDVDLLLADVNGPATAPFDLNGDATTDFDDVEFMLFDLLGTAPGDANLDGTVDTADLAILAGNFGSPSPSWAIANFTGDNGVGTPDLAVLAGNFGPAEPGSTLETAEDLGNLGAGLVTSQVIGRDNIDGGSDTADLFKITVDGLQNVNVLLTNRTDGARVSLLNSDGATLDTAAVNDASNLTFSTPVIPGDYFIQVEPFATGDESLYNLFLTPGAFAPSATTLTSGQTVTETIATFGEIDFYTIDANAGDDLLFTIGETTNFFETEVALFDPSGQLVDTLVPVNAGNRFDFLDLAQSGTYTYAVFEDTSENDGTYSLTATVIDTTVDADNVALTSGQTESGFIAFGDIDTFTIDANAGDDLLFAIGETTNFFELDVTLYDPSGQIVAAASTTNVGFRLDVTDLAASGTYTYVVREDNALNDGGYTLTATVIDTTVDADNVALTSGQSESGVVAFGDIDTFTIDADAGDDLLFAIGETTNFFELDVTLYDPSG
ncbi:MAG: LEPR-XLL domain-containing protein, partial [Planctomycetota bacterium]